MGTPNVQSSAAKRRTWVWWVAGGCVLLLIMACVVAAAAGVFFFLQRNRPTAGQPTVEYILDSSPRMAQPTEGGSRIEVARGVMAEIVRPANPALTSGLRVFGNGALPTPCQDTKLIVPFAASNQDQIANQLEAVKAGSSSDSAFSEAMISAIKDLAGTGGPNSLVVVTGGADSCNPQAAELMAQEAQRAGIDLKTFVIGFQVPADEVETLKSQVGAIPGSSLQMAEDADSLRSVMTSIQLQVDISAGSSASTTAPAAGSSGVTACDHPYLPLRPGATWSYGGDFPSTWTVESVSGNKQNATAHVTISFAEGSFSLDWKCSPEGILYYQMGDLSASGIPGVVNFNLKSSDGVTLPKQSVLTSGGSWNSSYTLSMDFNVPGYSGSYSMQSSESSTVGSPQKMSVAGGSFDVIPVTSSGTVTSSGGLADFSADYTTAVWFAKGVGIVRFESTSAGQSTVSELQSYSVP
jgi:hypothetical protein